MQPFQRDLHLRDTTGAKLADNTDITVHHGQCGPATVTGKMIATRRLPRIPTSLRRPFRLTAILYCPGLPAHGYGGSAFIMRDGRWHFLLLGNALTLTVAQNTLYVSKVCITWEQETRAGRRAAFLLPVHLQMLLAFADTWKYNGRADCRYEYR